MYMTALRARCWGVISSELCIDHLLEERREVGAETRLPRGGESVPELGWVAGHSTSHCWVFGSIGTENRFKECSPYHSGRVRANKTVNCGHMHPEHLGDLFGRLAFTQ